MEGIKDKTFSTGEFTAGECPLSFSCVSRHSCKKKVFNDSDINHQRQLYIEFNYDQNEVYILYYYYHINNVSRVVQQNVIVLSQISRRTKSRRADAA